jgi:hypothetical protein
MASKIDSAALWISCWAVICTLLIACGVFLQMSFQQLRRSHVAVWRALGEPHILGDPRITYPARKFLSSKQCRALNDEVLTRRARISYCSGMIGAVLGLTLVATVAVASLLRAS